MPYEQVLNRVLIGASDANVPFGDLCGLLRALGFELRVRGSHHIFSRKGVEEILNLQPKGHLAKPYQVKQVRNVILKHHLAGLSDE
jgi:predicted RNA binding protein YcfA (HicA-like mRNA interferase family)